MILTEIKAEAIGVIEKRSFAYHRARQEACDEFKRRLMDTGEEERSATMRNLALLISLNFTLVEEKNGEHAFKIEPSVRAAIMLKRLIACDGICQGETLRVGTLAFNYNGDIAENVGDLLAKLNQLAYEESRAKGNLEEAIQTLDEALKTSQFKH